MAAESLLQQLLDEISDSGRTPEEVCVACPELLPEVRRRWRRMCALEAELDALASEAMRRFTDGLPTVVAEGTDRQARGECLVAAWLAGSVLSVSNGLQHKLAHVLGGLGLPHAEAHAIILPQVTRFNLVAAPDAKTRLSEVIEDANTKGPQFITRHGSERAVILSVKDYRALTAHKPDLREYLLGGPKVDRFDVPRSRDRGRKVNL